MRYNGAKEETYIDGNAAKNAATDHVFGVLEIVLDEFGFTRDILINKNHFTIGRSPDCDIVLEDNRASRVHAHIRALGNEDLLLEDLGSSHGTFIEGIRITKRLLEPGMQITVGSTVMRYKK